MNLTPSVDALSGTFRDALEQTKTTHTHLFTEQALRAPSEAELTEAVHPVPIATQEDIARYKKNANTTTHSAVPQEELRQLRRREASELELPDPTEVPDWLEERDAESDPGHGMQRDEALDAGFPRGVSRVGLEILAIYLPFHFYPDGVWGIRFCEARMYHYLARQALAYPRMTLPEVAKVTFYSVARHEFAHYLLELEAFGVEVKGNRPVYAPYWQLVYKPSYPGADCIEETVANVWAWDNGVVRVPAKLRNLFVSEIRRNPWPAYARGANLDAHSVRPLEDELNAQLLQLVPKPSAAPPVWGSLPRPYVQPWTRYENVSWTIDRCLGGRLGRVLNTGPMRQTMRIYHR